jgi:glycosidase
VLTLRHTNKALLDGDYVALNENDPNVYTYLRRYKNQAVLVVLNMSDSPQKVSLDVSSQGFGAKQAKTLVSTNKSGATQSLSSVELPPWTVYVGELAK